MGDGFVISRAGDGGALEYVNAGFIARCGNLDR
jgi:hypothetical protein